jgi:DNA-binding transcriptional regulator GbsR (MarR family)
MTDNKNKQSTTLTKWERLATEAVGEVIDFWGFKHNHGRVWALLFIRGDDMTGRQLRETLELSKGAVSMLTNDLSDWGVIARSRPTGARAAHYRAEDNFLEMIRHVIQQRELSMVEEVSQQLEDAVYEAEQRGASDETIARLRSMSRLATMVEDALELFLSSARLDVTGADEILGHDSDE